LQHSLLDGLSSLSSTCVLEGLKEKFPPRIGSFLKDVGTGAGFDTTFHLFQRFQLLCVYEGEITHRKNLWGTSRKGAPGEI